MVPERKIRTHTPFAPEGAKMASLHPTDCGTLKARSSGWIGAMPWSLRSLPPSSTKRKDQRRDTESDREKTRENKDGRGAHSTAQSKRTETRLVNTKVPLRVGKTWSLFASGRTNCDDTIW